MSIIAYYCPDYDLIATFLKQDGNEFCTAEQAAKEFYAQHCSDMCMRRDYQTFADVLESIANQCEPFESLIAVTVECAPSPEGYAAGTSS